MEACEVGAVSILKASSVRNQPRSWPSLSRCSLLWEWIESSFMKTALRSILTVWIVFGKVQGKILLYCRNVKKVGGLGLARKLFAEFVEPH